MSTIETEGVGAACPKPSEGGGMRLGPVFDDVGRGFRETPGWFWLRAVSAAPPPGLPEAL